MLSSRSPLCTCTITFRCNANCQIFVVFSQLAPLLTGQLTSSTYNPYYCEITEYFLLAMAKLVYIGFPSPLTKVMTHFISSQSHETHFLSSRSYRPTFNRHDLIDLVIIILVLYFTVSVLFTVVNCADNGTLPHLKQRPGLSSSQVSISST